MSHLSKDWIHQRIAFILRYYVDLRNSKLTPAEQSDAKYRTLVFVVCLNMTTFAVALVSYRRLVHESLPLAQAAFPFLQIVIYQLLHLILLKRKRLGSLDTVFVCSFFAIANIQLFRNGFEPVTPGVYSYMVLQAVAVLGVRAGLYASLGNVVAATVVFFIAAERSAIVSAYFLTILTQFLIVIPMMILRFYYDQKIEAMVEYEKREISAKMIQRLSHELNNPLAIMRGQVEARCADLPQSDRSVLEQNIERIADVIIQMQSYAAQHDIAKLVENNEFETKLVDVIRKEQ